jgi:endonuclease/exonuclease/phosphatase family metal-dependent hydrolase
MLLCLRAIAVLVLLVATPSRVGAAELRLRIVAANLTSGTGQDYDLGHGNRILQGLKPDVCLVQELNYLSNTASNIRSWVDSVFGSSFHYFREAGGGIPNAVVSRYPILAAGEWDDTTLSDRDFVWARLDIPGDKDLWVISVHLKASSGSAAQRNTQAQALRSLIQANIPAQDYLVLGGDFNTFSRTESCINTFSSLFITAAPYPVDQSTDGDTNAGRSSPYDWVLADADLDPLEIPVVLGSNTFPQGLVFDSRVYTPLSEVPPVLLSDSAATNMQHMAVVRDFGIPVNGPPQITAGSAVNVTMSRNGSPIPFALSLAATDPDGDPLVWSVGTPPTHGQATTQTLNQPAGTQCQVSYTPALNYVGSDLFVVSVSDGQGGSANITVQVTILPPPNQPPTITTGSRVAVKMSRDGHPFPFALQLNALDPEGQALTWSIGSNGSKGTAALRNGTVGSSVALSYAPNAGFAGTDSFVVRVTDAPGAQASITVEVTVTADGGPFGEWLLAQFGALPPQNRSTVWGPLADPDGDGRSNLEEFAMNTDPESPDAASALLELQPVRIAGQLRLNLLLTERMDTSGLPALRYIVEERLSGSNGWRQMDALSYTLLSQVVTAPLRHTTLRLSFAPSSVGRRWYRLRYQW